MKMYNKNIITLIATFPAIVATRDTTCSNQVADFNVVDTSTTPPIVKKLDSTVDLSDFPSCTLNIEAVLQKSSSSCHNDPQATKCVKFFLDDVDVRQEIFSPYTIYGNKGQDFSTRKPPLGTHSLKACTYSDTTCTRNEGGCKEMNVTFLDCDRPTPAPVISCNGGVNRVTGFELVDTESPYTPDITPFTPPVIDLALFPTCALNIFATVHENKCTPIKCVKLSLGDQVRNEKISPYALYGNKEEFIRSGKPALGAQTLKACTYTDNACTKGRSGCLEIDVFVKGCVNTPTLVPSDVPTIVPTQVPSDVPTTSPMQVLPSLPTLVPSEVPTLVLTQVPSDVPTSSPSPVPSDIPTIVPAPVPSDVPTSSPSDVPTLVPSDVPTIVPTQAPSDVPTGSPTSVLPKIKRLLPLRSIACSTATEPCYVLLDKRLDTHLITSPTKETTLQAHLGKNYLVMSVRLSYRNLSSTQMVRVLVYNEEDKQVGTGDFLLSHDGTLEILLKSPVSGGVPIGKKFKIAIPRSRVQVSEVSFWGDSTVSEASSGKTISWGLAVVVDFVNSKLEDYGSGDDPTAMNNVHDIRKQLDLMENHWLWISRGAHQIEWVIERITLDQSLAPNEFQNSWEIFREAVATKVLNKVRLSHYDLNLDGILDHAWFVTASKNNTDNEGFFYLIGGRSINNNVDIFVDGQGAFAVKANCTGCFNHEVAHTDAIGLPDLYGDFSNLGPLSIMSYPWGSNPGGLLAFELMKTGWFQPLDISETTEAIILHPMEDEDGQAVLIKTGDQNEYFMLEYHKQPEVGWGSEVEIDGIVITHIFDSHWNTTLNFDDPPLIRIEAADGALQYGEWPVSTSFWYPENEAMPEAFIGKLYGQEQGIFRVTSFERVENGISVGVYFGEF